MNEAQGDTSAHVELPEVLDANAIANIFGVSARVAGRWLAENRIPNRKVGKRRFVLRAELLLALRPERPGRQPPNNEERGRRGRGAQGGDT